jgi:general nucleoside transport system ATP-binding protein
VLRRGEVIGTVRPAEATEQSLATMMVGRPVELTVEKARASPGADVLRVSGLRVVDQHDRVAVDDLDGGPA